MDEVEGRRQAPPRSAPRSGSAARRRCLSRSALGAALTTGSPAGRPGRLVLHSVIRHHSASTEPAKLKTFMQFESCGC